MNPFYIKNKFNIPLISPLSNSLVYKRVDARTHIYISCTYIVATIQYIGYSGIWLGGLRGRKIVKYRYLTSENNCTLMARYLRLIPIFNFVFQFRYNRENFSNESRKSQARDDRSEREKVIVKDGKTSSDGTIHVPSNVSISKGNRSFASLSLSQNNWTVAIPDRLSWFSQVYNPEGSEKAIFPFEFRPLDPVPRNREELLAA